MCPPPPPPHPATGGELLTVFLRYCDLYLSGIVICICQILQSVFLSFCNIFFRQYFSQSLTSFAGSSLPATHPTTDSEPQTLLLTIKERKDF